MHHDRRDLDLAALAANFLRRESGAVEHIRQQVLLGLRKQVPVAEARCEFRKDQKPVDPEPWWATAARKVR